MSKYYNRLAIQIFLVVSLLTLPTLSLMADEELRIGIFPRRSVAVTLEMFSPLSDYLGKQLGRKVTIDVAPDMPAFWSRLENGEYDLVHLNQYHYVRANARLGWHAILMNEEFGKDKISGALWVLKDSSIERVQDLRGKLVVFGGGSHAMVSSIMTKDILIQAGLKKDSYIAMSTLQPVKSILSVFYKQADAAGVGSHILKLPIIKKKINVDKMRLLAKSRDLPHLPWAVPVEMNPRLKNEIIMTMLRMNVDDNGRHILKKAGLTALKKAQDHDYDEHREIIKRVLNEDYHSYTPISK